MIRLRDRESGIISVLAAAASLAAIISLTLAVDVGSRTLAARELQGAVDVAALDAVRGLDDLAGVQSPASLAAAALAQESGWITPSLVDVELVDAGSVRVTASADAPGFLLLGDGPVTRSALASLRPPSMAISVGSRLLSISTEEAELLNGLFGQMLGGVSLSAVSYQGLSDGELTLRALQQELAAAGYSVGTVDQLLSAQITFLDLYNASIQAVAAGSGSQATIDALGELAVAVDSTLTLQLGGVLKVDNINPASALDAEINVFDLVKATAYLADGDHFVTIDVPLSLPGTVDLRIIVQLIEPPQIAIGPPGSTVAETAQVDAAIDLVNPGNPLVDLPASIEAARATADFVDAPVPDCDLVTVDTTTTAVNVSPGDGNGPLGQTSHHTFTGDPPAEYTVGYAGGELELQGVLEAAGLSSGALGGLLGHPLVDIEDVADAVEEELTQAFDVLGVGVAEADVRLSELICQGRQLTG